MSISVPAPGLDTRTYQDLVDEALARIPIHNPEWTNFNRADPGVTLVELFAFLTESLLYRANQIPERNRRAFLSLLGVPVKPAASARGLVTLANVSGPQQTIPLAADLEVRAGTVPFRSADALDLLPVEAAAYTKQPVLAPAPEVLDLYNALYASWTGTTRDASQLTLYRTVPLAAPQAQVEAGVDLATTVDGSLWIALLLRRVDGTGDTALARARTALAGRTISLGIVPVLDDPDAQLSPLGRGPAAARGRLTYQLPSVAASGSLGETEGSRIPTYLSLDPRSNVDPLDEPGVVQLTLPGADGLWMWQDIEPLEAGVGDLPPALEDPALAARLITWLRVQSAGGGQAKILWAGPNATMVTQQARVRGEVLPAGTGAPDQAVRLANAPVLPDSVNVRIGTPPAVWTRVDDLLSAGPEVPVPDLRLPPGAPQPAVGATTVFSVDAASGVVHFGDGLHGARPPAEAPMRADYAYGQGAAGNVGAGEIAGGPALPPGVTVTNPVRTWGGAAAQTIADAESEISRYLRHRDRLVSAEDFEAIVRRTPGADVGRVDVLPAFNPTLVPRALGQAPGAVTLMLIPRTDARHPGAPQPDQPFLDAVCAYLDPRRLVTTEVFLRGPSYQDIWVSIGFDALAGESVVAVRESIKAAITAYLSPLPASGPAAGAASAGIPAADASYAHAATGWPREKPVLPLELLAVASRVPGVDYVRGVFVAAGSAPGSDVDPVPMTGLQLPAIAGLSVESGDPLPLEQVRGLVTAPAGSGPGGTGGTGPGNSGVVPVPIVPDTC